MVRLYIVLMFLIGTAQAALIANSHKNIAFKVACSSFVGVGNSNCKFPKNLNNPYWSYPISPYIRTTSNICAGPNSTAIYNGTGFPIRWLCPSNLPFVYKSPGYPADSELFTDETKTDCLDTSIRFMRTLTDSSIAVAELSKYCTLSQNFSLLSVSPSSGISLDGSGIELTITGYELGKPVNSDITVSVGGSPCTPVVYDTDGKIRCTTTAHSPGLANVVVNRGGLSATISNGYLYDIAGYYYLCTTTKSCGGLCQLCFMYTSTYDFPITLPISYFNGSSCYVNGGIGNIGTYTRRVKCSSIINGGSYYDVPSTWFSGSTCTGDPMTRRLEYDTSMVTAGCTDI